MCNHPSEACSRPLCLLSAGVSLCRCPPQKMAAIGTRCEGADQTRSWGWPQVDNREVLNCYYAHADQVDQLQASPYSARPRLLANF